MSKYKYLLFDCDDTVLDFKKAEVWAIRELLKNYGIEPTDEYVKDYVSFNELYWKEYELGHISRETLLNERFRLFFARFNLDVDGARLNIEYLTLLTKKVFVIDGIEEVLKELSKKYELYIITNGVKWTQEERFKHTTVTAYFKDFFISEVIGYQKPKKEYFDVVIDKIGDKDLSHYLVIGDSLSSDILGGKNMGIDTLWFNRFGKTGDILPTYEIRDVKEYLDIL